ncbi:MAG: VOC family protein [Terriglobales bacterium]
MPSLTQCNVSIYTSSMEPVIKGAIPVLPAADTTESLKWWTEVCGFKETFRDRTPPTYAGIQRGEAYLHIAGMDDKTLARQIADQTMVRIAVKGIEALYAEYQARGGKVHPNGSLQTKPWGTKEFSTIDPNGVCVTIQE